MKAKCINGFVVEMCDGDGFSTDDEMIIEDSTIWEVEEDTFRVIGGEVRLTNDDFGWLELSREHFEADFEIIKEGA